VRRELKEKREAKNMEVMTEVAERMNLQMRRAPNEALLDESVVGRPKTLPLYLPGDRWTGTPFPFILSFLTVNSHRHSGSQVVSGCFQPHEPFHFPVLSSHS